VPHTGESGDVADGRHKVEEIFPEIADAAAHRGLPLLPRARFVWPVEEYAQAMRRGLADEAYWFSWATDCSREGNATIRVARLGAG
jgi:hypothetical protein